MSKLQLRIFDGTRQLFSAPAQILVTITDGNKTQHIRNYSLSNDTTFDLPFLENFGGNYTVLGWANGNKQAGFVPVVLSDKYHWLHFGSGWHDEVHFLLSALQQRYWDFCVPGRRVAH